MRAVVRGLGKICRRLLKISEVDIEISEDEIHLKGADGLDLKVSGRIPDKWALLLLIAIASMLGLNELGLRGL